MFRCVEAPSTNAPVSLTPDDVEHLRLLSVFHYIVAAFQGLFASFPILHFLMGAFMVFGPLQPASRGGDRFAPALVGGFFMAFAGVWMLFGWTVAVCIVLAGRNLARHRRHTFCFVVAAVEAAMCMPLGTILGVFTILVLIRPQVKAVFEREAPASS